MSMPLEEFVNTEAKMCNGYSACEGCPVYEMIHNTWIDIHECLEFRQKCTEEYIAIVEKWYEDHKFEDTAIDTAILCCFKNNGDLCIRHFAGLEDGKPTVWYDGRTSKTTKIKDPTLEVLHVATQEEIEEYVNG